MLSRARKKLSTVAAGLLCLGAISLSAGPAHAQPNRYAEDWETLNKVMGFASSAFGYVNGAISAIRWLTGANGAPTGPTLDEIRVVVMEALRGQQTEDVLNRVNAAMTTLREIQNEVASHAAHMGNPDDLMRTQWAVNYLSSRLANIQQDASYVYATIETILRRDAIASGDGNARDKQAIAVIPAFITLVPLRMATMKMTGELHPSLAAGEGRNIDDLLQSAARTYFRAVGVYAIRYTWCPGGPWCAIKQSPIGLDQDKMFKRQLYSYHHRLTNGQLNTYPALRWSQYERIPIVNTSLRALYQVEETYWKRHSGNRITFDEQRVWLMDAYTDPNNLNSRPRFSDVTAATISHYSACDIRNPQMMCPKIETQGN
jgi:hypothetical protein